MIAGANADVMKDRLWECHNDYVVEGQAERGICFGLSALWLKAMLAGCDAAKSRPDAGAARAIQEDYYRRMAAGGNSDEVEAAMLKDLGLAVGRSARSAMGLGALGTAFGVTGHVLLKSNDGKSGHFTAAVFAASGYYFFDPVYGAWMVQTAGDLRKLIRHAQLYPRDETQWFVRQLKA